MPKRVVGPERSAGESDRPRVELRASQAGQIASMPGAPLAASLQRPAHALLRSLAGRGREQIAMLRPSRGGTRRRDQHLERVARDRSARPPLSLGALVTAASSARSQAGLAEMRRMIGARSQAAPFRRIPRPPRRDRRSASYRTSQIAAPQSATATANQARYSCRRSDGCSLKSGALAGGARRGLQGNASDAITARDSPRRALEPPRRPSPPAPGAGRRRVEAAAGRPECASEATR